MPSKEGRSGRTSFAAVGKHQKISRKDALAIRACHAELPNLKGFTKMFAEMHGVNPDTIRKIIKNELHCD